MVDLFLFYFLSRSSHIRNSSADGSCVVVGGDLHLPEPQTSYRLWVHSKVHSLFRCTTVPHSCFGDTFLFRIYASNIHSVTLMDEGEIRKMTFDLCVFSALWFNPEELPEFPHQTPHWDHFYFSHNNSKLTSALIQTDSYLLSPFLIFSFT